MYGGNSDDLNVADLVITHNKRKDTRLKVYNQIYQKCVNKIKYINDVLLEREAYFSIPTFRWGLPFYQHKAALGFIMIKLRGKGFDVHYVDDGTIYINWNKLVETAMNDSYPARQLASADGIAMDIADTTVPKPSNIAIKDDRFHKLETEGCGGECCTEKKITSMDPQHKRVNKKQRLEAARQQQQSRIRDMLKYKNY
jgi:hypothetical protein